MPVIFTKGHEASKNRETVASPKKSTAHPLPSETKNEPAVKPPLPTPLPARKVDLNTALVEEIQALPGMGPGMAAHILAGRPYADLDDLARNGVPLSLIEQIKPYIVLSR